MNRPLYAVLAAGYPSKQGVDQAMLYTGIGHPEFANDRRLENTCATRVSLALLAAGIHPMPGNLDVLAGRFAGLRIETSQKALSAFLRQRLGPPEVYKGGYDAWKKIRPRHGIVSFFHIHGGGTWDTQGHIDLVAPERADDVMYDLRCANHCYWSSGEVWFWPLR
jgi:hypothetical protein